MKQLIKTTALAAVAGALLSLPASGALVNGSFENSGNTWTASYNNSGFGAMIVPQNSTVIPGWTVQSGQLDWDQSGAFGLYAQDGSYYLDLTDDEQTGPAGVAQTSISTIPNAIYHISGWLGSSSVYNPGTTQPTITVNINGNDVQTFTGIGYQAPATSYWQEFGLDFIATGNSTLLALQGGTVGTGNNYYIGLDNISVSMVPEPTTMLAGALLLLPFGANTLRILRRRTA